MSLDKHGYKLQLDGEGKVVIYVFFLSYRKVKDTLPLFRQFFSSAFSLTYVSLASMKLPPDVLRYSPCCLLISIQMLLPFNQNSSTTKAYLKNVVILSPQAPPIASSPCLFSVAHFYTSCLHRALLAGLTSNPHINDLHLDISGCEVSVHLHICTGVLRSSYRDRAVFSPHTEWGNSPHAV